jgi:organic hydroperoxide reductase OsmC/OhrA
LQDLTIELENRPGALAEMGETLGRAGISLEGGGAFVVDDVGVAHFLVQDGSAARRALEAASIRVTAVRDVILQRLNQDMPGQLGKISRRMAGAGVDIEVLYSDHDHNLILVVNDLQKGRAVSEAWTRERERAKAVKQHNYQVNVRWTGNTGEGTKTYHGYRRDHVISSSGKPEIPGSSDPNFRGEPSRYNPEELLVASLSSCHMLWYLHLCSTNKITVIAYEDIADGAMAEGEDGSGEFVRVQLKPRVTISAADNLEQAHALHHQAHEKCFIANSVKFPVEVTPDIIRR